MEIRATFRPEVAPERRATARPAIFAWRLTVENIRRDDSKVRFSRRLAIILMAVGLGAMGEAATVDLIIIVEPGEAVQYDWSPGMGEEPSAA